MQEQAPDFFFCFFLLSQLSEPGRLGTALSGPASRLASAMTFSGCDTCTSLTVDCCSFSICQTQSPEEPWRVGERSLGWTDCRAATLTFFFLMLTREGEDSERGETKFSAGVPVTAPTTMHAEKETAWVFPEHAQRHSEVRAGRLSGRFRLRAYRTVQTRPLSSRSVHHRIFPGVDFYTQSLQRPHKWRPMASRREQISALFFVAWTQRRLTECFPWATEGPNPPKETLTLKKDFFWQTTSGSLPAGLNWFFQPGVVLISDEIAACPFPGKPFFGTQQYCRQLICWAPAGQSQRERERERERERGREREGRESSREKPHYGCLLSDKIYLSPLQLETPWQP